LHWSHNDHFHPWILRQLPEQFGTALDVGCGRGALTRLLAKHAERVDSIDASAIMIQEAERTSSSIDNIRWILGDVLKAELDPQGYDVVTAVASLHHLPLDAGLTRLAELVRPGGVLLVVGLYRADTVMDRLVDALNLPANAAVGVVKAARGTAGKPNDARMPVTDASTTLRQIRQEAQRLTEAQIRRRLFWRYTLEWRRPAA
jgi:SAM-dependent methyltransferase